MSLYDEEIDDIDQAILDLIGERNDLVAAQQSYLLASDLPVWDQDRVDEITATYVEALGEIDGRFTASAIIGTKEQLEILAGVYSE